jgi:hypothetical protein
LPSPTFLRQRDSRPTADFVAFENPSLSLASHRNFFKGSEHAIGSKPRKKPPTLPGTRPQEPGGGLSSGGCARSTGTRRRPRSRSTVRRARPQSLALRCRTARQARNVLRSKKIVAVKRVVVLASPAQIQPSDPRVLSRSRIDSAATRRPEAPRSLITAGREATPQ